MNSGWLLCTVNMKCGKKWHIFICYITLIGITLYTCHNVPAQGWNPPLQWILANYLSVTTGLQVGALEICLNMPESGQNSGQFLAISAFFQDSMELDLHDKKLPILDQNGTNIGNIGPILFSACGWARYLWVREDLIYVMSSFIGWDLAQP